jgi:hypothetical protein
MKNLVMKKQFKKINEVFSTEQSLNKILKFKKGKI